MTEPLLLVELTFSDEPNDGGRLARICASIVLDDARRRREPSAGNGGLLGVAPLGHDLVQQPIPHSKERKQR